MEITDIEGNITYSPTIHVKYSGGKSVQVYNNIQQNTTTVQIITPKEMTFSVQVYSMDGRRQKYFFEQSDFFEVDLEGLVHGMYVLVIQSEDGAIRHTEQIYKF